MADISISNNVQILPPLKGTATPARKGTAQNVPEASASTQVVVLNSQSKTGPVNSGVNVVNSDGRSLYDTVSTAVSGQSASLGATLDIKA